MIMAAATIIRPESATDNISFFKSIASAFVFFIHPPWMSHLKGFMPFNTSFIRFNAFILPGKSEISYSKKSMGSFVKVMVRNFAL